MYYIQRIDCSNFRNKRDEREYKENEIKRQKPKQQNRS